MVVKVQLHRDKYDTPTYPHFLNIHSSGVNIHQINLQVYI